MARAAEILKPTYVVVENVPAVTRDTGNVLGNTVAAFKKIGYNVASAVHNLSRFGVPQNRKRHLLIGTRGNSGADELVRNLGAVETHECDRNVLWAIDDLSNSQSSAPLDTPTSVSDNRAPEIC